jgi:uncharacterized membrane protein
VRGHGDLRTVAWASALCVVVALAVPWEAVRALAAIPLCLLLPGYAIVSATFARQELGGWQRALLTLAISLMVLALGSLALNYVPGGIQSISWALLLFLVVLGCCRSAALRREPAGRARSRRRAGSGSDRDRDPAAPSPLRLRLWDGLMLGAAVIAAAAAIVLAQTPVSATNARGYTELWMLPASDDAGSVLVGVASQEQRPLGYKLEVKVGAGPPSFEANLDLRPGEERVFSVPLEEAVPGRSRVRVDASLIRGDRFRRVYRRVTSWLPTAGSVRR